MARALHPELSAHRRRQYLCRAIVLFNGGRYLAAHEAWEEVWRSTTPEPRDLFQGLIQVAVGMYHFFERGRREPARRLLAKGRRRLASAGPACLGLDLAHLLEDVRRWEAWLEGGDGPPPPTLRLRILRESEVQ